MDKNAIKKYATWARRELISRVSQKAEFYGVTAADCGNINADSIDGRVLSQVEKSQRQALIRKVQQEGFEQAMEEVAYTWFNRFSALRYMEVNHYLPTRVRVFTNEAGEFRPQILDEAIHLELDGLDMEKVYALKEANETEALYRYLLITQCNALSKIMPVMFQKISDYTELLLPDYLLREGSVIEQMVTQISESDWDSSTLDENGEPQGQVQIIGWLYQYYNAEKKDEVFAALKKNVKITKENIPAATQLFTPDWIVRYMVENSLGRLWVEGHPNDEMKAGWKYYLEEAEQEPEVEAQLTEIRKEYAALNPEDILCIDPCAGSGHILAYLFDVLMQIYTSYGYTTAEAVRSIIEKNLYGLDIDERAAQLAYFSVMMKARSYDRRFLTRKDENGNPDIPQPHVYAIVESNELNQAEIDYFTNGDPKLEKGFGILVEELRDAKEYGSILNITQVDFAILYARVDEVRDEISMYRETVLNEILPLIQVGETLAQKYHVVVTNPPYMGSSNMNPKLNDFIKNNYADYKSDFFSAFIAHSKEMTRKDGYLGFFTPYVWMFIQSYEKLRNLLYKEATIETLIQFEYSAFEEATVPVCTLAFKNSHVTGKKGCYLRLTEFRGGMEIQRQRTLEAIGNHDCGFYFEQTSDNFSKIPGSPVAYWVSEAVYEVFKNKTISDIEPPRFGMSTSDNNRFVRIWHEVLFDKFAVPTIDYKKVELRKKWYPYNNGGEFRRWYGDNGDVVNWENDGAEIKAFGRAAIRNKDFYLKAGITWTAISSANISVRAFDYGFLFSSAGFCIFEDENKYVLLALLNSTVAKSLLKILSPTINFNVGDIARLPVIIDSTSKDVIDATVLKNITLSKSDWDAFETSWDFKCHPLVIYKLSGAFAWGDTRPSMRISSAYMAWEKVCNGRFYMLKANEEELNRIFIDIYGLQNELTPEVMDKDVTVRLADKARDIRSFISYAVGCMFGRYSLDVGGLAYAGGEWDDSKYKTFIPDKDAILPICDDEYFEDDIVNRFIDFVRVVYGEDTLEENLKFIADALGGVGSSRQVIRNYFINDFYNDHCKIYQKRPIYWLFDSGRKNGFKCLIYIHRYKPDTIARIRTDYVHEQQARYRTAIAGLENQIANASTGERVKLNKQLKKLQDQADELHGYEEKIHHLADQFIPIDLDDGVKHNYEIFKDVLAKIK